jgi:hypothetical protein
VPLTGRAGSNPASDTSDQQERHQLLGEATRVTSDLRPDCARRFYEPCRLVPFCALSVVPS